MALSVMLADDNGPVRRSLRALLEREGFNVVGEAADGQEAVDIAQKNRPDVVLLDLSMPRLNGIQAARQIQSLIPNVRTVILTVHRDYHYVAEALEAGVHGYILKSRAVKELAKGVHQVAKGKHFFGGGLPQKIHESLQAL